MIKITLENDFAMTSLHIKYDTDMNEIEEFVENFIKCLINLGCPKDSIYEMLESFVDEHNERKKK